MKLINTEISGCYEVICAASQDARGTFVKTFHQPSFEALGLRCDWQEEYYSVSAKNVIRGMHFQIPPHSHAKLVYCLQGEALDVLVDLRRGSPNYGSVASLTLSPEKANSIYIPSGVAHGFLSLKENTVMQYKVTSVYSAQHDAGVLWSSLNFDWPVDNPVISARDQIHPSLEEFDSTFEFLVDTY
ncbi:dTDP-4-dehydrorhamnose 3,5-epimerase [Pseudomonas sp. TE3786]